MGRPNYTCHGSSLQLDVPAASKLHEQGEFAFELGRPRRVRLGGFQSLRNGRRGQTSHQYALASLTAAIAGAPGASAVDAMDSVFISDDALGLEATMAANKLLQPLSQLGADLLRQLDCCKLLVAGACSAMVSRTCVAPLERVKMDLVLKSGTGDAWSTAVQVYRKEGVPGFWKGNVVNLIRTAPFKAVNFFSFEVYRKALSSMYGPDAWMLRYLAGACAGITATMACFPLDVVRMRLMAPGGYKYGGMMQTLAGIVRCEGWQALYAGCLPAVVGMAPAGAVYYGVYDNLKTSHLLRLQQEHQEQQQSSGQQEQQQQQQQQQQRPWKRKQAQAAAAQATQQEQAATKQQHATTPMELPALYTLLYGAMAGAASEAIVYPLEVLRRQMQLQGMAGAALVASRAQQHGRLATVAAAGGSASLRPHAALGRVAAAFMAIWRTEGPRGFYSGIVPNMLQVLPSAALSYYTYEGVKKLLDVKP